MPQAIAPMSHVADVTATVDWYTPIGFQANRTHEDCDEMTWASLLFGGGEIMFSAGGQASAAYRCEVDLYVRIV